MASLHPWSMATAVIDATIVASNLATASSRLARSALMPFGIAWERTTGPGEMADD